MVKHEKYYLLLNVTKSANSDEIRKAYKRQALLLHPDKCGNTLDSQNKFTEMKKAYDVLSDPQKREVYDKLGEDGIKILEDHDSLTPDQMNELLMRFVSEAPLSLKFALLLLAVTVIGGLLLLPIFLCLRVDGIVGWNWASVFVPIWIMDGILFCCNICSGGVHVDEEGNEVDKTNDKWLRFGKIILFVVFQVFVVMRLNLSEDWNMLIVFSPYFMLEVVILLRNGIGLKMALDVWNTMYENCNSDDAVLAKQTIIWKMVPGILYGILRICFVVLVALRIDHTISTSWWIIFIPVWLLITASIARIYKRYVDTKHQEKQQQSRVRNATDEDECPAEASKIGSFCHAFMILTLMSPFIILASRLQSGSFSAFFVVLPWFILIGFLFLVISCSCFMASKMQQQQQDEEEQHQYEPPTTADTKAVSSSAIYTEVD